MKIYVNLGVCLLSFFFVQAQETVSTKMIKFILDGENKVLYNGASDISSGEYYQISVEGLNTYLYNVVIEDSDITIEPQKLPTNVIELFKFDGISDLVANIMSKGAGVVPSINSLADIGLTDTIIQKNGEIKLELKRDDFSIDDDEFQQLFQHIEKPGINDAKKLEIAKQLANYFGLIYSRRAIDLAGLGISLSELYITVNDYQQGLYYITKTSKLDSYDQEKIDEVLLTVQNLRTNIVKEIQQIQRTNLVFEDFIATFEKLWKDDVALNLKLKKIRETEETLNTAITEIQKELTAEKYTYLQEKLVLIYNHKDFKYESLPFQVEEDGKSLEIKLQPRGESSTLPTYRSTLNIPNKDSNFWGVSTGFYYAKNLNENYTIKQRDTLVENPNPASPVEGEEAVTPEFVEKSYYSLVEEKRPESEVGFKAMVMRGWKLDIIDFTDVFFTIGIGGGLSISEKPKPRIFAAPGLAFGDKNKLTIDIGGMYMFYDVLSNAFDTNIEYTSRPADYLVTDNQIRIYYSVGYTIKLGGGGEN